MSLALIIAFAALLLLLLLALLWSRWPAWMKTLLIVGVTVLYFYGHEAVRAIWGVPSDEPLPPRFVMLAAAVDEPTTKGAGSIFLWVSEIVEGRTGLSPRAYRVKYSKELHNEVDLGLRRSKDGVSQMGTADLKNAGNRRGLGWLIPAADEQEVKIRDLPSPQLPEK
jgi:hypothetical protein